LEPTNEKFFFYSSKSFSPGEWGRKILFNVAFVSLETSFFGNLDLLQQVAHSGLLEWVEDPRREWRKL
jgi:hypothetical protein